MDGPTLPFGSFGQSLVQRAMDAVSGQIHTRQLKPGDTVPSEGWFAAKLGVSRAVMREAFVGLAALRVIDVANGRRPRVGALEGRAFAATLGHAASTAQISPAGLADAHRTVMIRSAELAATGRTDVQARQIVEAAKAIGSVAADPVPGAADTAAKIARELAFHDAVATASGNALYASLAASLGALVPRPTATSAAAIQVARAIQSGDPARAAASMAALFDAQARD